MIISSHELMPVIRSALDRGQRVRMTVTGGSMWPFIRNGDVVELEPPCVSLRLGDIVLAHSSAGHYVLHRVGRIVGDMFFLVGDAQLGMEGPFDQSALVGRVVRVFRGRRPIAIDRGLWRLGGLVWLRRFQKVELLWLAGRIRAIGRRILAPFRNEGVSL